MPYCTYNESRVEQPPGETWLRREEPRDSNMAPLSPPYPVSKETYISWHNNVSPPFPYHPVPLVRSLSPAEMRELAARVIRLMEADPAEYRQQPLRVLKNDRKCYILTSLSAMGLLAKTYALSA